MWKGHLYRPTVLVNTFHSLNGFGVKDNDSRSDLDIGFSNTFSIDVNGCSDEGFGTGGSLKDPNRTKDWLPGRLGADFDASAS